MRIDISRTLSGVVNYNISPSLSFAEFKAIALVSRAQVCFASPQPPTLVAWYLFIYKQAAHGMMCTSQ